MNMENDQGLRLIWKQEIYDIYSLLHHNFSMSVKIIIKNIIGFILAVKQS